MSQSSRAALLRRALVAAAAVAAVAVPAAHAADAPVVTGVSTYYGTNFPPESIVISGSGFTGATKVSYAGNQSMSFTVVSDHTINAVIFGQSGAHAVQVTGPGGTSPETQLATIWAPNEVPPNYRYPDASVAVTCRLGATGAQVDATLGAAFGPAVHTTVPYGSTVELGDVRAWLTLPARASGVADAFSSIVGNATMTSFDADVTGAAQSSIDLAAGNAPFDFPLATSVDGNKLSFQVASAASAKLPLPQSVGKVTLKLHGYHARVTLAGGATSSLDCLPKTDATPLLSFYATTAAPTVDQISPSTGPSVGGTRVHITGSGFVAGMQVQFGGADATDVTVVSPTEIDATTPPRPAGRSGAGWRDVEVGGGGYFAEVDGFTFVSSVPAVPQTKSVALTCTAAGVGPAHPTLVVRADTQPSAVVGEGIGVGVMPAAEKAPSPSEMFADLKFSAADVNAFRSLSYGNPTGSSATTRVSLPLTIGGTTHAGDTVDLMDEFVWPGGTRTQTPESGAELPEGAFADLPAGTGFTLSFNFGALDLGVANGSVGSSVVASLRAFKLTTVGANAGPDMSCAPSADAEVARIPIIDPTAPPTPTPTPTPDASVNLKLGGSATLKTLATGSVPLTGALTGSVAGGSGAFSGDLALDPANAKLVALGFLPVNAKLVFSPLGHATGTLTNGSLTLTQSMRIKLPSITVLGLQLAGGSNCQTKSPTALNLKAAQFDPAAGGLLTGTFVISDLTGCGALTGLASPLTAGRNNAIALKATPR